MAITSIATALTQYNDNLDWDTSETKARLALSALRYLKINRAQNLAHVGSAMTFEAITEEIAKIESFLNAVKTSSSTSFTSARSRWT